MIGKLKEALTMARNRMKQYSDKHRSERIFEVGEWVYLKLQPFVQTSMRSHKYSKIGQKYFGPFLIIDKIGTVAYKLDLPPDSQIHPVFHVSLLKKAYGSTTPVIPLPHSPRFLLQPRAIIDKRVVKRGNKAATQVLVHWDGLSLADASWEYLEDFKLRFPVFNS